MAERAQRQRRFRRLVAGSIVAAALVVAGVTGALWRRSEAARERAQAEALRAEAGKLLALGRTQLEADPTAALAYARGSLDLYDTPEARRFAVEVLWRGPVARVLDVGRALKQAQLPGGGELRHRSRDQPRRPLAASGPTVPTRSCCSTARAGRRGLDPRARPGRRACSGSVRAPTSSSRRVRVTPCGTGRSPTCARSAPCRWGPASRRGAWCGATRSWSSRSLSRDGDQVVQVMDLPDGAPRVVATLPRGESPWAVDADATHAAVCRDRVVGLRALDGTNRVRILGRIRDDPWGHRVLAPGRPRGGDRPVRRDDGLVDGRRRERNRSDPSRAPSSPAPRSPPCSIRRAGDSARWVPAAPTTSGISRSSPTPGPSSSAGPGSAPCVRWHTIRPVSGWPRATRPGRPIEFWPVASPRRRALPGFARVLLHGLHPGRPVAGHLPGRRSRPASGR